MNRFSKISPQSIFKSPLQMGILVVFIIYILFPIHFPSNVSDMIDSPLGMVVLFVVTVFLFCFVNPVLGVVYVFVAYELLRRSSKNTGKTAYVNHAPSQKKRDAEMQSMNPSFETTLEEQMINKLAPVGYSDKSVYIDTTFKPVAENVHNANIIE